MNVQDIKLASQERILQHEAIATAFFKEVLDMDYGNATVTDLSLLSHFGPFYFGETEAEKALQAEWNGLMVRLVDLTYGIQLDSAEVALVDLFDLIAPCPKGRGFPLH